MNTHEWEQFKLLVETNRGYVDIVIKTTAIYGGISAGILGFFGGGVDLRTWTVPDPAVSIVVFGFGAFFALAFLLAALRARSVAKKMDSEVRRLADALEVQPASHVGVLFLALAIAIAIFALALVIFGALAVVAAAALF